MKVSEAYLHAVSLLDKSEIDNASFEADCIFEYAFGIDRIKRINHPETEVDFKNAEELIKKRISGVPLQYILGKWDFYGFTYKVGEGVLIPRPETELLVENGIELIKNIEKPVIYDLCAGTGCIGLTLARLIPDSEVFLFEKSENAFRYLTQNSEGIKNAFPVMADIFTVDCEKYKKPDLIISNPPYIRTDDISSLQTEVQKEPLMALDGGKDGFDFYRLISEKWLPALNENGIVAVECGEEQSDDIKKMFSSFCKKTYSVKDFNGTERIVIGEK